MTLVASFDVENWPVLVGDTMISVGAHRRQFRPFNIPTHADVNARLPPTSEHIVSGLKQKATILSPHLALGWAGTEFCARSVFRNVLERNHAPTFHDVKSVLDERQGEAGMDLYVTGICVEEAQGDARRVTRFGWDSNLGWQGHKHVFPQHGDCYAGGTGADAFLRLLGNNAVARLPEDTPPLESAICVSLSHLGKLAGDQMRSGSGIDRFFGGAFEIVTLRAGQLQKTGDVAYHFWEAMGAPNAEVTITLHASLKVSYFEDYLVVRKLEFGGEVADAVGADEVYVIWPVHRSVDDAEKARLVASISRPSMNAQFSIFYVYLPEMQASHNTYVGVHKSSTPGESRMIAFVEEGDSLEVQIDAEISRHIRQALADTRI